MTEDNKQQISISKKVFSTIVVLSVVFGALAGGAAGLVSGGLYSGALPNWLSDKNYQIQENPGSDKYEFPEGSEEEAVTQAVEKVAPTVVSIIITKELQQYYNYSGPSDLFEFHFDEFFGQPNEQSPSQPPATEKRQVGGGTGFIVSADGLILTNKHVVADEEAEYSVILNNGQSYPALVLARDPFNDLAIIKIEAKDLPTVSLGDSDKIKIGQTVIAIGYSLGEYSNSVTKGIISGLGRDIVAGGAGEAEKLENVIQTDAAINPGNSGGPLISLSGEVIGINTAINQQGQLVGFAIPINGAKPVVDSVKKTGKIIRPYLGIRYAVITPQMKEANNLAVDYGALIVRGDTAEELAVIPGSPAAKAGLVENDIVLEVDGVKIDLENSLAREIAKHQVGDKVSLKIWRNGEEKEISATLEEFKE